MGDSSQLTEQSHSRKTRRYNTRLPIFSQKDDRDQSLVGAASVEDMCIDDSNAGSLPSRRSEELQELQELRCLNGKYERQITKLKRKLEKKTAKLTHERVRSEAYYKGYSSLLSRTVQRYADSRGIEISGEPDKHLESVLEELVSDARNYHASVEEVRQLRGEGQKKDTELHHAQEQLHILQAEMLSRVDDVSAVSDEHLAREFHSLVSCVRVLSRSIRTSKDTNMLDVLMPCSFLVGVPAHHWETRAAKKVYIEAWIWCILMDEIFGIPFSIFGKYGETLGHNWSIMFGEDHLGEWPCPSSASETSRVVMAERLLELSNRDIITKESAEPEDMKIENSTRLYVVDDILEKRKNVANILGECLSALSPAADLSQVPKIINKAFSLALDMSLSQPRIQVTHATTGAQFDEKKMSVRDTDDENLDERTVAFILRPGLTKWGDARGRNFEASFHIVPCEVKLEAGGVNGGLDSKDLMKF
jgi:hypothetical protein